MSSHQNQSSVEYCISSFKTTQKQSWSKFDAMMKSSTTIKKKKIPKQENHIQLTNEDDIHVFGLIPRLDNLTLISCSLCYMVILRNCMHTHFENRHKNESNEDKFSVCKFIMRGQDVKNVVPKKIKNCECHKCHGLYDGTCVWVLLKLIEVKGLTTSPELKSRKRKLSSHEE